MKKNYFVKSSKTAVYAFLILLCGLFANPALAQKNIGWTGATDNNWTTPTNWNYPAVTCVATYGAAPEISKVVIFTASTTTLALAGNVANNATASSNIPVGARVSGVGIAPNTTVTIVGAYDANAKTTTLTLSEPTTGESAVAGNNLLFQWDPKITLTAVNDDISVGDKVAGFGIPIGTTVSAIDATNKKIITLSRSNLAAVGTPGTNVVFTFATPKVASGAPTIVDIALISNGANPTIPGGSYDLGGITLSNQTGSIAGPTLTIPEDVEIIVQNSKNEAVLVKGGNIVNNGALNIINSLNVGSNNTAGAYGMTFGLPDALPTVPTEYTYSGTGTLKIDTSAGNVNSGGILFNGIDANANIATYKLLFNGTTTFLLSAATTGATPTANTHAMRFVGTTALRSCNVIIGGAGFTIGDEASGGVNGLMSISGGGTAITIAPETTINVYSNKNNPMNLIGSYIFGTNSKSFLVNKGTINFKGVMPKSAISLYTESNGLIEIENQGTLDVDMKFTTASQAAILVVGYNFGQTPNKCFATLNNKGTMNLKSLLDGAGAGHAFFVGNLSQTPSFALNNSGTLNITASAYSTGGRVSKIGDPTVTDPVGSYINNTGTINTNQELRTFYTINTSTGTINFASTNDNPIKVATFTVPTTAAAAVGTTYTDNKSNVYTVVVAKVASTGTTLITHVASDAVNPATIAYAAGPPEVLASALTKTGAGTGDASIVFSDLTTNNDNALFQRVVNSGIINTNSGTRAMTGITGYTTDDTGTLSPGGDNGRSIASFDNITGDLLTLRGTLKMQATGSVTAGIDYDQLKLTGGLDLIDISAATLDLTGIYIPTVLATIDIITTNALVGFEGGVLGEFANVVGKPEGWSVVYPGGLGGKVQLTFDPSSLATTKFSNFKFSAYPNPTTDQLNLSAAKTIRKVEIFNLLGQKVQSETVNATQKQLSISNLQKGLYLMEVTIDNARESFKIMKQ